MNYCKRTLPKRKRMALVAHDNMKADLMAWAKEKKTQLEQHELYATGTTGTLLSTCIEQPVHCLYSGPMGGDQQLGALITEGKIDVLIFFWDPLDSVPHDPDVKALLRLAAVWNIPSATNKASANFLMESASMNQTVEIEIPDYQSYMEKRVP
ncbi:methylglyoxal synthase [Litorilituus lipolyticus]|uniref:Methylglyoxal synthase n=1 Tax=Litorilituus lipolyticus TaxID=2491017 RepID=A0A502KXJ9_9GAMM|nr:methylglyoxal synthase [Litorilituus lipolyticus]TPH16490.1 methylglyoxal synthase [Litorilituus lipolyticus]